MHVCYYRTVRGTDCLYIPKYAIKATRLKEKNCKKGDMFFVFLASCAQIAQPTFHSGRYNSLVIVITAHFKSLVSFFSIASFASHLSPLSFLFSPFWRDESHPQLIPYSCVISWTAWYYIGLNQLYYILSVHLAHRRPTPKSIIAQASGAARERDAKIRCFRKRKLAIAVVVVVRPSDLVLFTSGWMAYYIRLQSVYVAHSLFFFFFFFSIFIFRSFAPLMRIKCILNN